MIHEGLIYSSADELVSVVAPFLREAVEADQPALAAVSAERQSLLRAALGTAAGGVEFHSTRSWYARPGAALVAWTSALDHALSGSPRFIRAVGEPPIAASAGREERWRRYESLFNNLYRDEPIWIICPYDAQTLSEDGLDVCRHTHPTIATAAGRTPSPEYFGGPPGTPFAPLTEPEGEETSAAHADRPDELVRLRGAVVWPAGAAGLAGPDAQDLALAVTELARASFAASNGPVTVRTRTTEDSWFCELEAVRENWFVSARGRIAVAVGGIVADRIELGDAVVRFVFRKPKKGASERILAVATELFGQQGIRQTTVNDLAARANVAKATFYSIFPSKDELVRTWVRLGTADWDLVARAEVEARAESPRERILAWFDVLVEWAEFDVRAGLSLMRAWSELRDPNHPAREQQEQSTDAVRGYLRDLASAHADDPEALARELQLLAQGAILEAVRLSSAEPVRAARTAAAKLLA